MEDIKEDNVVLSRKKREFNLNHLLEILQGSVFHDGEILIATSNEYENIMKLCPAMFRPGRLTPIYCGYIDDIRLQELFNYYFMRETKKKIINNHEVPTSTIIEEVKRVIMFYDDVIERFTKFEEKLIEMGVLSGI